jgi:signal transduction histidine kinase
MNTHLEEKQKRYIALARSSAEMLMSLCNDLLDMAQLDNGRFALRPAPCDVGQASRQACQTFVSHAISKGLVLKFEIDHPSLGHWVCDELRYKQVLTNLLSNAVKFTPREGAVLVRVGLLAGADPQVLVEVQDTGPGISATQQQRLFQDFSQLPNQSETQHADMAVHGAGLGLALCRRLVKQMKGEMGVRSTAGGGSTFWFRMPVSRETRTQGAAEQSA